MRWIQVLYCDGTVGLATILPVGATDQHQAGTSVACRTALASVSVAACGAMKGMMLDSRAALQCLEDFNVCHNNEIIIIL